MTVTRRQQWAFMPRELGHVDACHEGDEFVAYPASEEIGVVVYRNGTASNRFSDGRVGVPEFLRRLAEKSDVIYRGHEEIAEWRDVEVNDSGWAVRVCEPFERNGSFELGPGFAEGWVKFTGPAAVQPPISELAGRLGHLRLHDASAVDYGDRAGPSTPRVLLQ